MASTDTTGHVESGGAEARRVETGRVVTVAGDIDPANLGTVLPHEHVLSDLAPRHDSTASWAVAGLERPVAAGDWHRYEQPLSMQLLGRVTMGEAHRDDWRLGDEPTAVAEALDFHSLGGGTIVDATSIGIARNPAGLRRVSVASGVAIVMGSGWYHPAYCPGVEHRDVDDLADEIVRDVTIGVDGVHAGVIGTIAALDPAVPAERRVLVASARASARTGAPIVLARSRDGSTQREVFELLASEGATPSRIAVAHCDALAAQPESLEPILDFGAYALFDRLARVVTVVSESDDQEVAVALVALAERGYADQLLVSPGVERKHHLRAFGGDGYGYLLRQFTWLLDHFGGGELVPTVTVDNPRRWLTIAGAR